MNLGISCSICSASEESSESTPLLLDTYTDARTAYSFNRKLRTDYSGSAFRVRRDSDNAELDIGYSGNDVDESALTTFVGANSAYVVTAYDNSENGKDWTQSTTNLQPRIVNAGTVEKVEGKIVAYNLGANGGLISANLGNSATATQFHVYKNTNAYSHSFRSSTSYSYFLARSQSTSGARDSNMGGSVSHYINSSLVSGTSATGRDALYTAENSIQCVLSSINLVMSATQLQTLSSGDSGVPAKTYEHERILYHSDKSSERAAIETDINNYYSIY
jgi:hypothetical protein